MVDTMRAVVLDAPGATKIADDSRHPDPKTGDRLGAHREPVAALSIVAAGLITTSRSIPRPHPNSEP